MPLSTARIRTSGVHQPGCHTCGGAQLLKHKSNFYLLAAAIALFVLVMFQRGTPAQNTPQLTGVDPAAGKVNESVALTGQNLGKESVSAVFLSDDNNDYKATIVEQHAEKITMKIPQVKSGDYHISLQVGNSIFIKPLRLKVQE